MDDIFYIITQPTPIPLMVSIDTNKDSPINDFSLALSTDGTNGYIDWGDSNITSTILTLEATYNHTYLTPGLYTIKIYGGVDNLTFQFNFKVMSIDQWGTHPYKHISFDFCPNLSANYTDYPILKNGADLSNLFNGCKNFAGDTSKFRGKPSTLEAAFRMNSLFNSDLYILDTKSCTSFFNTFSGCSVFNKSLSTWNTSMVTDMRGMFFSAYNFNQDITSWDTALVNSMNNMFSETYNFNQDIGNWNVSNVTDMRGMFRASVFNQPLGNWDVSNVTDMASAFQQNGNFNQDINGWTVSNVTNMNNMFEKASNFNQPLDNWDISSVNIIAQMFQYANNFNQPLNSWDVSNHTDLTKLFYYAITFDQDLSNWDVSNVTSMNNMFYGSGLTTINYDKILIGWTRWSGGSPGITLKSNVIFGVGNTKYTLGGDAQDAHDYLTGTLGWTITDGGGVVSTFLKAYPNLYGESWSLHRLDIDFTGDVIEIERSSDNTVTRYGFNSSGELPLSDIAAFVGSGDGRLSWYKGQANGLELTQTVPGNQPWLFKNGVLQEEAGKPTLNFDGNQWLNGGNILNVESRPFVSIAVVNLSAGTIYAKAIATGANNRYSFRADKQQWAAVGFDAYNLDADLKGGLLLSNQLVVSGVHSVQKNNVELSTVSGVGYITDSNFDFQIGAYGTPGRILHATGNISEVHIYFEDKLSDLSDMNHKTNERYGIY